MSTGGDVPRDRKPKKGRRWLRRLKTEFAMGTEAYQIKEAVLRHAVDEHKIWLEVTIPMIAPFTPKGMIAAQGRKRLIGG